MFDNTRGKSQNVGFRLTSLLTCHTLSYTSLVLVRYCGVFNLILYGRRMVFESSTLV